MESRAIDDGAIEVCPDCKGLWVDWFDGELTHIAEETAPLSLPTRPVPEGEALACPVCQRTLGRERHAAGEAWIWRCGDCAGSFVPRGSFESLVSADEPSPPSAPSPLVRLIAALRALLGPPA